MTANERPLRVLIADDQDLVRSGFRLILLSYDGIDVVGEARDGLEAVELASMPPAISRPTPSCPIPTSSS